MLNSHSHTKEIFFKKSKISNTLFYASSLKLTFELFFEIFPPKPLNPNP
jgi:hypothetical protein